MLTGVFSTLLLPETKQRTLEDLSNEQQEGYIEGLSISSSAPFSLWLFILGVAGDA